MKALNVAALAGLALIFPPAAAESGRPGVAAFGWLSGTWVEEKKGSWTEERWAPPRAGVMLGTTLSGSGNKVKEFDFMRIAADAHGTVNYWGSPEGRPGVPFRLVSASGTSALFENPAHDYPTRISYRREGNRMTATISGLNGAHPISWNYVRR
jgi:hypothetical protein